MDIAALATWITAAAAGLYLLSIWLIEYDREFQSASATRLPPVVLVCHVLCAGGGLFVWAGYLIFDSDGLAWVALVAVLLAGALGTTMAIRWVGVYRETRAVRQAEAAETPVPEPALTPPGPSSAGRPAVGSTATAGQVATLSRASVSGPPERNFPLPVVIAHGIFAGTTIALVLLTALGVAGS